MPFNKFMYPRLCCLMAALLLPLCVVFAENGPNVEVTVAAPPPPPLSEAREGTIHGTLITSANLLAFKSYLIPELVPFVRGGRLEVDGVKALPFHWQYDESFSASNVDTQLSLAEGGGIAPTVPAARGLAFGGRIKVEADEDAGRRARKILWNSQSVWWSAKSMLMEVEVLSFLQDRVRANHVFSFARVYPHALKREDATGQLFRELLRFSFPGPVVPLSWLTFRFLGADEDVVWYFSPALQKARQLTGSNRSDVLVPGTIAADDLLGWSGKPELVDATVERKVQALAPFPGLELRKVAASTTGCLEVVTKEGASDAPQRWDTQRVAGTTLPTPRGTFFALRDLYRIELTSKDPFSEYGRQVLYVDAESMLPVYKFVFDKTGKYLKTVITSFGLAEAEGGVRVPYPSFTLIDDPSLAHSTVLSYRAVKYCTQVDQGTGFPPFDPRRMGPQEVTTTAANGEKGSVVSEGEAPPTDD